MAPGRNAGPAGDGPADEPGDDPPRFNVLGVGLCAVSLEEATRRIVARAARRPAGYVCVTDVHGVVEARADPALRSAVNRAFLVTPDGMPLVWLGRWHGWPGTTRVYGPDLMLAVCDRGRALGLRHFLLGGAEGVAAELRGALLARYPDLQVCGAYTPPFRPMSEAELDDLAGRVAQARPDVVWVGLGTPKQERFMAEHAGRLAAGLLIGVGAAFDFHSGRKRQAPRWIQRSGLEWLFRLASEPRRLWRRYCVGNAVFLGCLALQLAGLRRYPLGPRGEAR